MKTSTCAIWLGLSVAAAACGSVQRDVDRMLLDAGAQWVAEPAAFGCEAEWFEVDEGRGSMTGFLVRARESQGRTVVLFHDNRANVTTMHPYYTFLADAGFNVCTFDYRGFGRSKGEPSLPGMFYDLPALLAWLRRQPGVDPQRIAFYGLGFGAVVALHEASLRRGSAAALVLENVPSPRAMLEHGPGYDREPLTATRAAVLGFAGIPENVEPDLTAAKLTAPSLWIVGAELPHQHLRAALSAWVEARGDKQLWVLSDTGASPHALAMHDGDYQREIVRFLSAALDGRPAALQADWRRAEPAAGGGAVWEIELRGPRPDDAAESWCIEVSTVDTDGTARWHDAVLGRTPSPLRLRLDREPGAVGAARRFEVERLPGGGHDRRGTPLQRAARFHTAIAHDVDTLRRQEEPDAALAAAIAARIRDADQQGLLTAQLEHELADVFARIGMAMARDASRATEAAIWLERALAAVPDAPDRHWWPAPVPTFGFPQAAAVAAARQVLAQLRGGSAR